MDKIIEKAKEYVRKLVGEENTGHDYFHAMRVYNMALYLSVGKDVDSDIVALAAILHDLDDKKITPKGSRRAQVFLESHLDTEVVKKVMEIIENISYSEQVKGKKVSTLEGKIVQDADRLDALGAVGIARCFAYSGKTNKMIYKNSIEDDSAVAHFYQKLFKLENLMNTTEAKIIARNRINYMQEYLEEFFKEWR
jgi:uncharacterized protein